MKKKNALKIALMVLVIILLLILLWICFIKPSNSSLNNISTNISNVMPSTNQNQYLSVEPDGSQVNEVEKQETLSKRNINNVSMAIKENTLTRNGATLVITDNNEMSYEYGEYYKIEKLEGNNWISAPTLTDVFEFNSSYDYISNGNTIEFPVNWTKYYGTLENGQYRIRKDIDDNGKHYIYAEFIIE